MRRLSTKLPALIILSSAVATLFALSVICGIGGQTARLFAPIPQATAQIALDRRSQEAQVTATYIAVLSSEVVSDTQTAHALERAAQAERHGRAMAFERVANGSKMVLAITLALSASIAGIGTGVWLGGRGVAAGVRQIAIARVPPSRRLPDGTNLVRLPGGTMRVIETRAGGMVWNLVDDKPADTIAARDVREFQSASVKAFVEAFVEGGGVKLLRGGGRCSRT